MEPSSPSSRSGDSPSQLDRTNTPSPTSAASKLQGAARMLRRLSLTLTTPFSNSPTENKMAADLQSPSVFRTLRRASITSPTSSSGQGQGFSAMIAAVNRSPRSSSEPPPVESESKVPAPQPSVATRDVDVSDSFSLQAAMFRLRQKASTQNQGPDLYTSTMQPVLKAYRQTLIDMTDPKLKPLDVLVEMEKANDRLTEALLKYLNAKNNPPSLLNATRFRILTNILSSLPCPTWLKYSIATTRVYDAFLADPIGRRFLRSYHQKSLDYNEFQGFLLLSFYEKSINQSLDKDEIKSIRAICYEISDNQRINFTNEQRLALFFLQTEPVINPHHLARLLKELFLGDHLPLGFNACPTLLANCAAALASLRSADPKASHAAKETISAFIAQHISDVASSLKQKTGNASDPGVLARVFDEFTVEDREHLFKICDA